MIVYAHANCFLGWLLISDSVFKMAEALDIISSVDIPAGDFRPPSPIINVHVADHALDQNELMNNLRRDASSDMPPVSLEVKDQGAHVGFKCNRLFWYNVARPTFSSMTKGFTKSIGDKVISLCSDPTVLYDTNMVTERNQLQFLIATKSPSNEWNITVHLYIPRRTLQVHGGSKMPDKKTAAAWFTTEVVLPLFRERARRNNCMSPNTMKATHQNIVAALTRSSITGPAPDPSHLICFACKTALRPSSKGIPCPGCGYYYHDNHMKGHVCNNQVAPSAVSSPLQTRKRSRADVSNLSPLAPRDVRTRARDDIDSDWSDDDLVPLSPRMPAPLIFSPTPTTTHSTTASPLSAPIVITTSTAASTCSLSVVNTVSQPTMSVTTGQHQLVSALSGQPSVAASVRGQPRSLSQSSTIIGDPLAILPPVQKPASGSSRAKKKSAVPTNPQDFELEMVQRQLTMAKTKLASVENQIKDLEATNKILTDRICLFERRENDLNYAQLFSSLQPAAAVPPPTSFPSTYTAPPLAPWPSPASSPCVTLPTVSLQSAPQPTVPLPTASRLSPNPLLQGSLPPCSSCLRSWPPQAPSPQVSLPSSSLSSSPQSTAQPPSVPMLSPNPLLQSSLPPRTSCPSSELVLGEVLKLQLQMKGLRDSVAQLQPQQHRQHYPTPPPRHPFSEQSPHQAPAVSQYQPPPMPSRPPGWGARFCQGPSMPSQLPAHPAHAHNSHPARIPQMPVVNLN